jgi:hypothetical protein
MAQLLDGLHAGHHFLFQLSNPLLQGLPLRFLLGQHQSFLIKRTEHQMSDPACGTYLHGLNAPDNNLPIGPCSNAASICVRRVSGPSHIAIATARLAVQLASESALPDSS